MSGPVYTSFSGGALAGFEVGAVHVNGLGGTAELTLVGGDDELMAELLISGRLTLKEYIDKPPSPPMELKPKAAEALTPIPTRNPIP